jgi:hypothetical protein
MDLFKTLGEALKPEFIKVPFPKKPYYNVWVHVEAVTFDEEGNEEFTDLDEEFMPVKLAELDSKDEVQVTLNQLEVEWAMLNQSEVRKQS